MNSEPARDAHENPVVSVSSLEDVDEAARTLARLLGFRIEDAESAEVGRALRNYLDCGELLQQRTASDVLPSDDPRWHRAGPA